MRYAAYPPPPALAGAVECVWRLEGAGGGGWEWAVPDGSGEVIVNRADPFLHRRGDGTVRRQPRAIWVGQIQDPIHLNPTGRVDLVGIRLRPGGGARLSRISQEELTGQWVETGAVGEPGWRAVEEAALSPGPDQELVPRIFAALSQIPRRAPDLRTEAAVLRMTRDPGGRTVEEVAREVEVSRRTLERLFLRDVGLTPMRFLRIQRVQQVIRGGSDAPSLTRAALAAGYSDLPHLTRDFTEIAGAPPGRFFRMEEERMARILTGKG